MPVLVLALRHRVHDFDSWKAVFDELIAFGIQYEGKSGLSTSEFSWAA
jgi:hypothetical protein